LILSPKSFTGPLPIITIDETPSTTATCLGVKIEDKLSWKDHTLTVTKSFAYALSIWGNCSDAQLSRLNEYHCKVGRMILSKAKTDTFDYEILERIGGFF